MTEHDFDDDTPWASPEIRESYEAALGRFILAFNQLDNLLSEVIETVLGRLGRKDLVKKCSELNFSQKLLVFDLLKYSSEGVTIADVPVDSMRSVAGERNLLAHGHFDQNPFDGSYAIVRKRKSIRDQYSVEKLEELSEQATRAWDSLRHCEAIYEFSEPPTQ